VNLALAELSRLVSRRFVQLMAVLLIAAFGVTIATTLGSTHQPTVSELRAAEQQVEAAQIRLEQIRDDCVEQELDPRLCDMWAGRAPRIEEYLSGVFVFSQEITELAYFLIAFLALFAFLVAASFVGAELTSGGMTNLLLWRPQRVVVLGTKLATVLAALLAASLAAAVLYIGAFYAIAEVGGVPGVLDGDFWPDLILTVIRGLGLVLLAGALGFGAATLGRHTAAALGLLATYAVIWEIGARIVFEVIELGRPDQYMLSSYLAAWMDGDVRFNDRNACRGDTYFDGCISEYDVTWVHAGAVFVVILAAIMGGAFATFRHRDLA